MRFQREACQSIEGINRNWRRIHDGPGIQLFRHLVNRDPNLPLIVQQFPQAYWAAATIVGNFAFVNIDGAHAWDRKKSRFQYSRAIDNAQIRIEASDEFE